MRMRMVSLTVAALLMVVAIVAMATNGFNYALDFTGGTLTEMKFEKPVNVEQMRQRLEENGFPNSEVRTFGSGNDIVVRMRLNKSNSNANEIKEFSESVLKAAQTTDNPGKVFPSVYVGPQIGNELAWNGLKAAIFVVLGFLIYVWVRFEWKFAVAAIITTLHDVLLVAGWFAITQHELDLAVLAGILSVMGYSISDTIVVFDRVRENFRNLQRISPAEVLNRSVNQTLSRTIITSFVAFLTVLALYLYGGDSLKGMAESQIIGIVFGTLSSIFVACPLLLWLGTTKQDLLPKAKDLAELERRP
ncbi:MAG: protein translocase subunit SecF [Arenimonas sp.]